MVELEYHLDVVNYAHAAAIAPGTLFGVPESLNKLTKKIAKG